MATTKLTQVFATTMHGEDGGATCIVLKTRTEQDGGSRNHIVATLDAVEAAHLIGDLAMCLERLASTAPTTQVRG